MQIVAARCWRLPKDLANEELMLTVREKKKTVRDLEMISQIHIERQFSYIMIKI